MRIRDVAAYNLEKRLVLVKVETDNGLVGFGEASPMYPEVVCKVIDILKTVAVGESPFDLEMLIRKMMFGPTKDRTTPLFKLGPFGSLCHAISGIEIGIWDLLGKYYNVPVYNLIGGRCFKDNKIPVYASFLVQMRTNSGSSDQIVAKALECVDKGYKYLKLRIGTEWGLKFPDTPEDASCEVVKRVREAVGPDIKIMVDANCAYDANTAIRVGRELEKLGVIHYEEPVSPYDTEGMKMVSDALDLPVAVGENNYTRYQFARLISSRSFDIVQLDVVKTGGILEGKKIAAIADAYDLPVVVHNFQGPVGTLASMHFAVSTPNCRLPQEYRFDRHPMEVILKEPLKIENGFFHLPDRAGLGIEVDMAKVENLAV